MSLAPWLQGLPDPERMRATDRWAIDEQGIPGLELMERAGRGLADLVASVAPDGPIAIACGKGNNGGDGYVAARLLREAGRAVRVLAVAPVSELSGDARASAERVDGVEPFDAARLVDCSVAVDALLGTGFSGTPHGAVADAIDALNDAGLPIVAADVPSGVDAASGVVEGTAIRARATGTFAAAKPGLWINPGKAHAGTVRVIDIGIPRALRSMSPTSPSSPMRSFSRCCRRGRPGGPSSRAGTCSSRAARAGSPARRRWPPRPRSARGPVTSPPASPPLRSRSSPSGCSRR